MSGICPVRYNRTTWARHRRWVETINTPNAATSTPAANTRPPGLVIPGHWPRRIGDRPVASHDARHLLRTITRRRCPWAPTPLSRDRVGNAARRCSTAGDKPVQWPERAQRCEPDEVEPRHTALEPVTQERDRPVRVDLGAERWMNHRQLGDIDGVPGRQHDMVGAHLRTVRDGCLDSPPPPSSPPSELQFRHRLAFAQFDLADHAVAQPVGRPG